MEVDYDPDRENKNPALDRALDNNDDDDAETTTSLPSESPESWKGAEKIRRLEARHKALKADLDTMKIPSISKFNLRNSEEVREYINAAKRFIRTRFPNVDEKLLNAITFGKQPNANRLVVLGSKGGEQLIFKVDETGFMQGFISKYTRALGPAAERIIAQLNAQKRQIQQQWQSVQENIEMEDLRLKREEAELQKLQEKRKRAQAKLDQLQNEDDDNEDDANTPLLNNRKEDIAKWKQLITNYDQDIKKQQTKIAQTNKTQAQEKGKEAELQTQVSASENTRDAIEARLNATKSLDDLREHDAELERKNTEDQQILNDENATSSEKEAARERIAERNEEREQLRPQIQEREEALPLRERVKRIFKKYGWTLQAVALAVGIVLSALALAGLNGLKAGTKAVGQGLKAIGQKLGSLLPGLIGSIVSFIFKAAGQVFSFLAEHAWLLILAVVAFFVERLLKRRRKQ